MSDEFKTPQNAMEELDARIAQFDKSSDFFRSEIAELQKKIDLRRSWIAENDRHKSEWLDIRRRATR
jgi:hypothetical protein